MAYDSLEPMIRRAYAIADAARSLADAAQWHADQLAQVANLNMKAYPDPLVFQLSLFVMAIFVGYYVVWSVTPSLHTPLISVTNAISSVIVVGALVAVGIDMTTVSEGIGALTAKVFGFIALFLTSINIFGGFLITERMLSMYKKKGQS